jgi:hypothetical protein
VHHGSPVLADDDDTDEQDDGPAGMDDEPGGPDTNTEE